MRASVRLVVLCLFSSALIACLSGCYLFDHSSSTTPTPPHTPLPVEKTNGYAVADWQNNRVLIFNAPFSTDQNASVVLGQSIFNSNSINAGGGATPAANGLWYPTSVAVDASGNLYVGDADNGRVLQFKPPFTTNMNASVVFGESGMTAASPGYQGTGASASGLSTPYLFTAVDSEGDLWVSDYNNSRVVEYVPPFTNGMAATLAIGQITTGALAALPCNKGNGPGTATSSTLCYAAGISFDASGDLWVADSNNSRVLEFKPPFTTGMAASLEIGQPAGATAFTSSVINNGGIGGNPTASSLFAPGATVFDSTGNLWVTDTGNTRVLMYAPPFSNGMNATLELGDPPGAAAFTTRNPWLNQIGVYAPIGLSFDTEGDIFVTDQQYNRVMIFEPPFSNGMDATTVLGQADFVTGSANQGGISASTLNSPYGGVTF